MIGVDAFQFLAKRPEMQIFSLSISAIDNALHTNHSDSDIQITLDGKPTINPLSKLPPEYHGYVDVFSIPESEKLPSHRSYYHNIKLELGKIPDYGPMSGMSRDELLVLKKYLKDNLRKRFIRVSTSSVPSSVLFMKILVRGLRFCVDN